MYPNAKSLCGIPKSNIILYANYYFNKTFKENSFVYAFLSTSTFKPIGQNVKISILSFLFRMIEIFCLHPNILNIYFPKCSKILVIQFRSVAQSCPTLCDPKNRSTPGLPVHHQLPEPTQTHVHCVGDNIQSSHPLLSPSPPALNFSQHQGLFK